MDEPTDPRIKAARQQVADAEEAAARNDYRTAVDHLMNASREVISLSEFQAKTIHRLKRQINGTARQSFQVDDGN